jgi:Fur family ferric uptake transcriptional regulator
MLIRPVNDSSSFDITITLPSSFLPYANDSCILITNICNNKFTQMSHQDLDLASVLHREGHRMTPQRQMVLDAVCEIGGHARPEEVYELVRQKSPAVNRATVYRTLKLLSELGPIADTVTVDGRLVYEMTGEHGHHHLVCRICGANTELSDADFRAFAAQLQRSHGFFVDNSHVTLRGVCAVCSENRDRESG